MTWLKLAPYIGALVMSGAFGAWHMAKVRAADRAGYARAMDEVRMERDTEHALYEHKREVADRDYQKQVSELETRVDHLLARPPVVRVCKLPADPVRTTEAAPNPDAATDTRPAVQTWPDIGGDLILYGRDCEATRQQLTSLQEWIASLD